MHFESIQRFSCDLKQFFTPFNSKNAGAYFKLEQEASVQQHKARLVKEGKLPKNAPPRSPHEPASLEDSEHVYEVLPEVLQAQARVDDPNAARKREYEVRIKGEPPPLSAEDRQRYMLRQSAAAAAVGHVPRLSLSGRNRYALAAAAATGAGSDIALRAPSMSPEAIEVARRTQVAGMRALAYGSLLGFGLLALGGTAAASYLGIGSGGDPQETLRGALQPLSDAVRARVEPWKATAEAWVAEKTAAAGLARDDGDCRHVSATGTTPQTPPSVNTSRSK